MTGRSALIVGAGVAGLSAAWWLARAGWRVTVVERAANLRTNGYMIGLSGPGYGVARTMGLLPDLQRVHRRIEENLYLGRDGKPLLRMRYQDLLKGLEWITLSRAELVAVLHRALPAQVEVRFGVTAERLLDTGDGVIATLTDGTTLTADLLIGADGVHSQVRALHFGAEETFARHLGYRVAAFRAPDTLGLGHDFLSYAEPGRITELYTLADGTLATLYAWRSPDRAPVERGERQAALRAAFADAHPNALRWIDALAPDEPLYFDDMTLIEMPRWSKGRVLLLGDAAHCLTLLSGQGAGMAMASAAVLAEELRWGEIDPALVRHEARMRPAIQRLQERSRKIAGWFIPATPRAFAIRNAIMRWAPKPMLAWYFTRSVRSEILGAGQDLRLPGAPE
jgi:2-polyprenyl-6-methoxyphenol hydroxylase-like FAD-dependent oxidoreductase